MAATNIVVTVAAIPIPAAAPVERPLVEEDGGLAILICDLAELSIEAIEVGELELVVED